MDHELRQAAAGESAPLGSHGGKYVLGFHSQAQAGVGVEANTDRGTHPDRESGESGAGCAARGAVAPDAGVGTGARRRGDVPRPRSPPLVLLLLRTCHYQRKDSPVEALTLSPEPLWSDGGREIKRAGTGKQGGIKGNMRGRKESTRITNKKRRKE